MQHTIKNVSYDPEVDALYIKLQDGVYLESEELTSSCFLDIDKNHNVLGIELLDVKNNKDIFEYLFFKSGTFESWASYSPNIFLKHLQQDLLTLRSSPVSSRLQTA